MSEFSAICVIEGGPIEEQTLLMAESLRKFGGELKDIRLTAFHGRSGRPVSGGTLKRLKELGVEYVYNTDYNKKPWFDYSNKIAAINYAQENFKSRWCIWLDSDTIFAKTPNFVNLISGKQIDICARLESTSPAIISGDSKYINYWRRVSAIYDIDYLSQPFYDLDINLVKIKPNFNSGIIVWRIDTEFGFYYANNFYKLVDAKISPVGTGPWFADQVSLAGTILQRKMIWENLDIRDNLMLFNHFLDFEGYTNLLPEANIIHYSKSRRRNRRKIFDEMIYRHYPLIHRCMISIDALEISDGPPLFSLDSFINNIRKYRQRIYVARCESIN